MAPLSGRGPRFSLLCFGFVVCGVVTVLPGPLLPLMAARWGLLDVQSGAFFAAEFAASMVGSIFSPRRLRRNLPLGYAVMTGGVLLLLFSRATEHAALGHSLALTAFATDRPGHRPVRHGDEPRGRDDGGPRRIAARCEPACAKDFRCESVVGDWGGRVSVDDCGCGASRHAAGIAAADGRWHRGDVCSAAAADSRTGARPPTAMRASALAEAGTLVFFAAFFFLYRRSRDHRGRMDSNLRAPVQRDDPGAREPDRVALLDGAAGRAVRRVVGAEELAGAGGIVAEPGDGADCGGYC